MTLKIKKSSKSDEVFKRLKLLAKSRILIGIQGPNIHRKKEEGTYSKTPANNVEVATFNEFGTETIPERSFIRASINANSEKYTDHAKLIFNGILNRKVRSVDNQLNALGLSAQGDMQVYARDLKNPPNTQSTIDRKGTDNPLVGLTGQLINSITYVIEDVESDK